MARNTTRQGANFELDVMRHLEWYGYTSLRSSGSRGAVDIVSIPARERRASYPQPEVLYVQCKITNPVIPPSERQALIGLAIRGGALPIVAYKGRDGRRRPIEFRELTGPGPKDWRLWSPGNNESG